jgi:uncharacterized membrane protein (DUF441 family)
MNVLPVSSGRVKARNLSETLECSSKAYIYIYKQVLVAWLVGDHLLLRDFGLPGMIFMNVYVITIAMVMLFRDFVP